MQYTTKFKRLVSCLLVFVMLLGMIPFSLTTLLRVLRAMRCETSIFERLHLKAALL